MSKRGESGGKMRTKENSTSHEKMKDPRLAFDYSKHIVTTRLYCLCRDCMKYRNFKHPIQCIDPFLMDMKHTYWIYHGLVNASRTERAICLTEPGKIYDKPERSDENITRV